MKLANMLNHDAKVALLLCIELFFCYCLASNDHASVWVPVLLDLCNSHGTLPLLVFILLFLLFSLGYICEYIAAFETASQICNMLNSIG